MSQACVSCRLVRFRPAGASVDDAKLSYERLAAIRTAACRLRDSGVLYLHELSHLDEVIGRLDGAVRLKGEREADAAGGKPADPHDGPNPV